MLTSYKCLFCVWLESWKGRIKMWNNLLQFMHGHTLRLESIFSLFEDCYTLYSFYVSYKLSKNLLREIHSWMLNLFIYWGLHCLKFVRWVVQWIYLDDNQKIIFWWCLYEPVCLYGAFMRKCSLKILFDQLIVTKAILLVT